MTKHWHLKRKIRALAARDNLTYSEARARVLLTKVVGTLSPCGGGGRTTIAATVALLAAREKRSVIVLSPDSTTISFLFDVWRLPIVQRPEVVPVPLLLTNCVARLADADALRSLIAKAKRRCQLLVIDFWRDPDLEKIQHELDWAILSLPSGRLFPSLGFLPRAETVVKTFGRRTLAFGLDCRCGDEPAEEFEVHARRAYGPAEALTRRHDGHWAGRFPHSFDPSERGALDPAFWRSAKNMLRPVLSF